MRTIKFKGKVGRGSAEGEWKIGALIVNKPDEDWIKKFGSNVFILESDSDVKFPVSEKTVGQFTGFYDENNKEIYEGDIIQWDLAPYVVEWLEKCGEFILYNEEDTMSISCTDGCHIVGNIHDDHRLYWTLWADYLKKEEELAENPVQR